MTTSITLVNAAHRVTLDFDPDISDAAAFANFERLMLRRGNQPTPEMSADERAAHVLFEAMAEWVRHTEQEAALVRLVDLRQQETTVIEEQARQDARLWTRPAPPEEEAAGVAKRSPAV